MVLRSPPDRFTEYVTEHVNTGNRHRRVPKYTKSCHLSTFVTNGSERSSAPNDSGEELWLVPMFQTVTTFTTRETVFQRIRSSYLRFNSGSHARVYRNTVPLPNTTRKELVRIWVTISFLSVQRNGSRNVMATKRTDFLLSRLFLLGMWSNFPVL